MKGFKEFILRGNVIDLAVAVVIGAAFTSIVTAIVTGIINTVASSAEQPELAWAFVHKHYDALQTRLGPSFRDSFIANLMTNFSDGAHAAELLQFAPAQATSGGKVTTAAQWRKRRAEIKALFDDNVYGRYPAHIPKVSWHVDGVETMDVQGVPATVKHVTGHVDNSAYPAIAVDIKLDVVTPAAAKGRKVPVIIGGSALKPRPPRPAPPPGAAVHMLSAPKDVPESAKLLLDKQPITDGMNLGIKGYEKVHVTKGPGQGLLVVGAAWIDVDKSNYKDYPF